MEIEGLREAIARVPFEPFSIQLADGRSISVKNPEFVAVGKRRCCGAGELPAGGGATAALCAADFAWGHHPTNQACLLQRFQMLTHGGVGQIELGRQLACRRCVDPLQPFDQASLGIGHVDHA